jgi:cell division protein YceG involved in septum cleavage
MKFRALSALVLVAFLIFSITFISRAPTDYPKDSATSPVEISVDTGESGSSIAQSLQSRGVILSAKSFIKLALSDPRSLSISPGGHLIDRHIPSSVALQQLLDPARNRGLIRVIEGSTVSDISSPTQSIRDCWDRSENFVAYWILFSSGIAFTRGIPVSIHILFRKRNRSSTSAQCNDKELYGAD